MIFNNKRRKMTVLYSRNDDVIINSCPINADGCFIAPICDPEFGEVRFYIK